MKDVSICGLEIRNLIFVPAKVCPVGGGHGNFLGMMKEYQDQRLSETYKKENLSSSTKDKKTTNIT